MNDEAPPIGKAGEKGKKGKHRQQQQQQPHPQPPIRRETRDEVIARFHQRVQGIIDNMHDDLAAHDARINYDTDHAFYNYRGM